MLARGDFETEPVEDLAVRFISEMDIVEEHSRLADHQRGRSGCVLHFGLGIDQAKHLRHVDQPLPDRPVHHAEHVKRAEQLDQIGVHQHQIAGGQHALAPLPHGEPHRAAHQQVHDDRLADVEQAERVLAADRCIGIGPRGFGIARVLARLGAEIFDRFVIEQAVDRAGERGAV